MEKNDVSVKDIADVYDAIENAIEYFTALLERQQEAIEALTKEQLQLRKDITQFIPSLGR